MQSRFLKRVGMFAFGMLVSHVVIYLAYAYASWEFSPGDWSITARATAAFWSWAFGSIAGLALAVEGVK